MGEPFFLLLCAIKQQINKGSIDAVDGQSPRHANEEWLLRENIGGQAPVSRLGEAPSFAPDTPTRRLACPSGRWAAAEPLSLSCRT